MKIVRVTVQGRQFYVNLDHVIIFFEQDGKCHIGTDGPTDALTVIEEPFNWFLEQFGGYSYYDPEYS